MPLSVSNLSRNVKVEPQEALSSKLTKGGNCQTRRCLLFRKMRKRACEEDLARILHKLRVTWINSVTKAYLRGFRHERGSIKRILTIQGTTQALLALTMRNFVPFHEPRSQVSICLADEAYT